MTEDQSAARGTGPLLQRDYWAIFEDCTLRPSELMAHVKTHFCELPPPALVEFSAGEGLARDARIDICIRPAQDCQVRVIHEDGQSLTLGTMVGHPEAGRITFGAYRNPAGALIFHIRSRARSSSASRLIGFFAIGEAMQTNTWTDFINNTAASAGARVSQVIHAETTQVEEEPEDDDPLESPTFLAVGD